MILQLEPITENSCRLERVERLAREAFPPEEYLPPRKLIEMAASENFDFWAMTDGGEFVGFMVVMVYESLAYLFFLAIELELRGKGYGGRALETLRAAYPEKQPVVDFEMPDKCAPNRAQRERRRAFYLRNGYRETGLFLSYLGVDYEVFGMTEDFDAACFKRMMKTLKIDGFHPKYFTKPVQE